MPASLTISRAKDNSNDLSRVRIPGQGGPDSEIIPVSIPVGKGLLGPGLAAIGKHDLLIGPALLVACSTIMAEVQDIPRSTVCYPFRSPLPVWGPQDKGFKIQVVSELPIIRPEPARLRRRGSGWVYRKPA
jgi:hypothetical protein